MLFDLIESEADVNIFLDREGFTAKAAGIIITSNALGHMPKRRGDKYTLWFGRGIERETFKKREEAYSRALEIIGKAKEPIKPRVEGKDAKGFTKYMEKAKP